MRIWIVRTLEPLPIDGEGRRPLRAGILARMLAARGHQVLWWNATIEHTHKIQRFDRSTRLVLAPGIEAWCLFGRHYRHNVSAARLASQVQTAAQFRRLAVTEPRPDVIFASMPTIELAYEAVRYGRQCRVPVALDIRDMWPDIWAEAVPSPLRGVARLALAPWAAALRSAIRGASAICGFTDGAVEWALAKVGRPRTELDRCFPFAYETEPPPAEALAAAERFWDEHGIGADSNFVACFFGMLSDRSRAERLVEAAARLDGPEQSRPRIVICGDGEARARMLVRARGLEHVVLPGWVDRAQIWTLLRRSHVGLLPYPRTLDFVRSVPNKAIEYLSGGVPIVTSMQGEIVELLSRHGCGVALADDSAAAFAAAIGRLAAQPEERAALAAGAVRAFAGLDAEQVYGALIEHLARLAAAGPPSSGRSLR